VLPTALHTTAGDCETWDFLQPSGGHVSERPMDGGWQASINGSFSSSCSIVRLVPLAFSQSPLCCRLLLQRLSLTANRFLPCSSFAPSFFGEEEEAFSFVLSQCGRPPPLCVCVCVCSFSHLFPRTLSLRVPESSRKKKWPPRLAQSQP
jgi:hypothetical protein